MSDMALYQFADLNQSADHTLRSTKELPSIKSPLFPRLTIYIIPFQAPNVNIKLKYSVKLHLGKT